MKNSANSKQISEKIARAFSIMYNRASMYKMDHPFVRQSIQDLYLTVTDGFELFSPLALILNRGQFYIEEEAFDSRLNTARMAAHFKKADIQSISFENGMSESELSSFVEIFVDPVNYPKATLMKDALADLMVSNIKINHIIYKKMTADDEIVSKETHRESSPNSQDADSQQMFGDVVNMMAESVLMEEIGKSFSLKSLLENPIKLSNDLIVQDLQVAKGGIAETSSNGSFIADQLMQIRDEVTKLDDGGNDLNLSELADAVFNMRDELLKEMEVQKSLGVIYENEGHIIDEAKALTDQVLIQLVRKEYQEGKISTERLAQILRRMIPEPAELKRLLPLLKNALLAEGMSMSEFLELMDALGKELQNDGLVEIFRESAKEVGLDSEDLISEFKQDPAGAAELIYLASELRKGTGDEKILADLLVDYIERIGSKITLDAAGNKDESDGVHLKKVMTNVESEIISRLGQKGIDDDVLDAVQEKLMQRMESCFNKLKTEWEGRMSATAVAGAKEQSTIFKILEDSVGEKDELYKILLQVRNAVKEGAIDENNVQEILKAISQFNKKKTSPKKNKKLPSGILTYRNTRLFLEKEISRCNRYDLPFTVITFSILKVKPKQPIPKGALNGHQINQFIMEELANILRDADLIGILNKKILIVLLPMTEGKNAKMAMQRILRSLHAETITVKDLDLNIRCVAAVTAFDCERTPDLESFLRTAENDHNEFLIRLRNIQDLY